MKIQKIEFENFRNFKEHGYIQCSTDGKVTIIYGNNGDGKTTLHQLFQWVLYGRVKFNKTTTDILYNLEFESQQNYGSVFDVMGRIDFEHDNVNYSITRKRTYKKEVTTRRLKEEVTLYYEDEDNNWVRIPRPDEVIEKMLPSGLSEYFFFDGESMIADLSVKGKDSADKLRKALFSMLNLDIIEAALSHIGKKELKTTVIGKLYISKGDTTNNNEIKVIKEKIEELQNVIMVYEQKIAKFEEDKEKKREILEEIVEKIGSRKSNADYVKLRQEYVRQKDILTNDIKEDLGKFGATVNELAPRILIAPKVKKAKEKLIVHQSKMPVGINEKLLSYLLDENTHHCICGNVLMDVERNKIREYLQFFPPHSSSGLYNTYINLAKKLEYSVDMQQLNERIVKYLDDSDSIADYEEKIYKLDEEKKKSSDISQLIIDRARTTEAIKRIDSDLTNFSASLKNIKYALNARQKEFDTKTQNLKENKIILRKMDIMEKVAEKFRAILEESSKKYSKILEENIRVLLTAMLTSKRNVHVSEDFAVRVIDSYNDESKSEGQFAVVSFAYIGGVLNLLKHDQKLFVKEYPLVLDGPFSKLDPEQKDNVIKALPTFANQVIIFSKDNLHDKFSENTIGYTWVLKSNSEKNVARVEEAFL